MMYRLHTDGDGGKVRYITIQKWPNTWLNTVDVHGTHIVEKDLKDTNQSLSPLTNIVIWPTKKFNRFNDVYTISC